MSPPGFRTTTPNERAWLESLQANCYGHVVEEQSGEWNSEAQARFLDEKWKTLAWQIIESGGRPLGALAIEETTNSIALREILIAPEHQNRGYGSAVIQHILNSARKASKSVQLKVLLRNRARGLYRRLGFTETHTNETLRFMEWKSSPSYR